MNCTRCGQKYVLCVCVEPLPKKATRGPVTTRTIWNAACKMQREQIAAGIKNPRLTTGPVRPAHIEKKMDSGRITDEESYER